MRFRGIFAATLVVAALGAGCSKPDFTSIAGDWQTEQHKETNHPMVISPDGTIKAGIQICSRNTEIASKLTQDGSEYKAHFDCAGRATDVVIDRIHQSRLHLRLTQERDKNDKFAPSEPYKNEWDYVPLDG